MSSTVYKWMLDDVEEGKLEGVTELIEDESGWGMDMVYNGWKKMCLRIAEDHGRQPILEHDYNASPTDGKPNTQHTMKVLGSDIIIGTLEVFYK